MLTARYGLIIAGYYGWIVGCSTGHGLLIFRGFSLLPNLLNCYAVPWRLLGSGRRGASGSVLLYVCIFRVSPKLEIDLKEQKVMYLIRRLEN